MGLLGYAAASSSVSGSKLTLQASRLLELVLAIATFISRHKLVLEFTMESAS